MLKEQIGGMKARYFVFAGLALMMISAVIDSDYSILTAYEHGYADSTSLQRVVLPFSSASQADTALNMLVPTMVACFIFAVIIAIMRRKA